MLLSRSIGVDFKKEGRSLGPLGVVILGRFEGIIEDDSRVDFIVDYGASKGWFYRVVVSGFLDSRFYKNGIPHTRTGSALKRNCRRRQFIFFSKRKEHMLHQLQNQNKKENNTNYYATSTWTSKSKQKRK